MIHPQNPFDAGVFSDIPDNDDISIYIFQNHSPGCELPYLRFALHILTKKPKTLKQNHHIHSHKISSYEVRWHFLGNFHPLNLGEQKSRCNSATLSSWRWQPTIGGWESEFFFCERLGNFQFWKSFGGLANIEKNIFLRLPQVKR